VRFVSIPNRSRRWRVVSPSFCRRGRSREPAPSSSPPRRSRGGGASAAAGSTTTPTSWVRAASAGAVARAFALIPTRWPNASASPVGRTGRGSMSGDRRRCAAIALLTRFRCRAELSSVGKKENGRGGAVTPPDPAPSKPAQWRGYFQGALTLPLPARLSAGQEATMGGRARGHVAVRRRRGDARYAVRCASAGKRHYLALGSERDGWNPSFAERVLLALGAGFVAGLSPADRDPRRNGSGG
jgi:hypothetical protein